MTINSTRSHIYRDIWGLHTAITLHSDAEPLGWECIVSFNTHAFFFTPLDVFCIFFFAKYLHVGTWRPLRWGEAVRCAKVERTYALYFIFLTFLFFKHKKKRRSPMMMMMMMKRQCDGSIHVECIFGPLFVTLPLTASTGHRRSQPADDYFSDLIIPKAPDCAFKKSVRLFIE